ncbi:MAG: Rrf2 family transcriptional regulator [Candidatus Hydrogenedentes bacterium]|nr:Rrf2 family transcriptional regulator [Candidatus Hydrogenedentota bacterium]
MFQLYSKACEYALLALIAAGVDGRPRFRAADVCEWTGIPEPYTRKVLQSLVRGGFLDAERGPGGGYSLTRGPEKVSILEVVKAVDGGTAFDNCIMGFPKCGSDNPCPLHDTWTGVKERLVGDLEKLTLRDAIDVAKAREE